MAGNRFNAIYIAASPQRNPKGCKESSRWSESSETTGNAILIGSHPGGVPELLMQRSFTLICNPDFRLWAQLLQPPLSAWSRETDGDRLSAALRCHTGCASA